MQTALAIDLERPSQQWANLNDLEDIPEPESLDALSHVFAFGGLSPEEITVPRSKSSWSISHVNPSAALLKLPGLQLKPTWRWVGYLYREGDQGAGLIFALPVEQASTTQLEKALGTSGNFKQPPQPAGALPHFMEAIEGDRSAVSFLMASLLYRELCEFGAAGHLRNWTYHRLIDAVPAQAEWRWQTEQPQDLSPKVKVGADGQAIVEFFSCRVSAGVALYRHLDRYPATQYKPQRVDKPLATLQR